MRGQNKTPPGKLERRRPRRRRPAGRPGGRVPNLPPKTNPSEIKKLRIQVGHLKEKFPETEAKQNELTTELEAPETYTEPGKAQHLNRELSVIVDQLATATAAWELAAEKLAALER